MKVLRASAIALVGWYLILPPRTPSGVDSRAPLARWTKYKDYESAGECALGKVDLQNRARGAFGDPSLELTLRQREQFQAADCIADDDPRLQEKGAADMDADEL